MKKWFEVPPEDWPGWLDWDEEELGDTLFAHLPMWGESALHVADSLIVSLGKSTGKLHVYIAVEDE